VRFGTPEAQARLVNALKARGADAGAVSLDANGMRDMDEVALTYARTYLADSLEVAEHAARQADLVHAVVAIAVAIERSLRGGGKVMLAGNGGSAGDAQHIAGEFLSRLNFDRAPLPAIALTTDASVLTAVGNDYGFERVFERQVRGIGRSGDVLVAISTSGRSPNILRALEAARSRDIVTVGFAGRDPRDMGPLCDLILRAPSDRTPLIQQVHITAAHIVCGLVERALFGREV
jgi:D-sedoheptulose 7-phosphate isomerase